jgi:ATP-dependent Lon protease
MTGELSLVGKVLPVGGIKEKLLAAKRAGVNTVILPKLNEKDIMDVPAYAIKDMKLHFVSHIEEVFELALADSGVPKAKLQKPRVIRSGTKSPRKKKQGSKKARVLLA